jgi:signal transduction histidine kinase/CheY-like chemotaxis protein
LNLRWRLRGLIVATLLPVGIFGLAGSYLLFDRERDTFERGARDRVRALITAVDAEIHASVTPLELLARSPSLRRGDIGGFRKEAEQALEARRGKWVNVVMSHPETAEMLMNLRIPAGQPLFHTLDPETVLESARGKRPVVSQVVTGVKLRQQPIFAVRVPVVEEGKVRYVLSAILETATIGEIVDRQGFPRGWAAAVIDGSSRFVVRRPAPAGGSEHASESLKKALERAPSGWDRGKLLDGTEIYRAFHRSSLGGWSASIAMPRAVVEQGFAAVWLLVAGFVAAAALGLWIAWWLAARISRPIIALAEAAPALGRGEASALPDPGPVHEVRELARSLGEAARAIRDREEQQRRAEQALLSADRAKDEFLAMLGHELRNPLASVSNVAQLLEIAPDDPGILDNSAAILRRQIDHMTRLVDDLLEVGRVTGGKVRIERQPLDLAAVAREVFGTWKTGGRFRRHQVTAALETAWINADRARIEQVVSNLLDNALKYTPAGGAIRLAVRPQEQRAILEVTDTGMGMSPELLGRAFDLFVQGERTLAREPGGLGIGLTMAKRLVELHDGTIAALSSGPGGGASFIAEFPLIDRPAEAPAARDEPGRRAVPARVLVVEDNADARASLAALLRTKGYDVATAENGTQGIAMAETDPPDFALIDIGLPDVDGYEVARRLKSLSPDRRPALVAITGYGTREDRRRALAAGFDEHLAKPVELHALESVFGSLGTATRA